jgi:deoxyribodipyrimidine photo-lyase
MKSIFLFRRDFRIIDNTGLNKCFEESNTVYPIFIFTPIQIKNNPYKSSNCVQFMIESLEELSKETNLSLFYGNNNKVIEEIIKKNKINAIYTNTDYTPFAVKRDKELQKLCDKHKVKLSLSHDVCLYEPGTIKTKSGTVYQKFTPFYNTVLPIKVNEPHTKKKKTKKLKNKYSIDFSKTKKFYKYNKKINVTGGRKEAKKILDNIKDFKDYDKTRDLLSQETTHLSCYIKFGCVSIREVYHSIKKKFSIKHSLIRQLIWRDFYYHLGFGFPKVLGAPLKKQYGDIKWSYDKNQWYAWIEGKTGYPIVDAGMRQLLTTGYVHNRARLIVASFLIKNLQHNWLDGEKFFAQQLVDYDVLVNNGNWQWVAGTGADSQPYFRIFNPWAQSKKFDKDCIYIKHWIPELKDVPTKDIHNWEKAYTKYSNIDYPKPIVDYKKSRELTLNMYKKALK